ncbi:MAG: GNAT family N-acetyltransferase [Bacteriovoracaceae bacterium]
MIELSVINTKRLVIEPVELSHVEGFHKMQSDENMYRFVAEDALSFDEIKEKLEGMIPRVSPDNPSMDWLNWCVFNQESDLIGHIEVAIFDKEEAVMAFMFNSNFWGKGYALESCKAVIKEIKKKCPKVKTIELEIDTLNESSLKLAEKLGFSKIKVNKEVQEVKGRMSDEAVFTLPLS